MSSMLQTETGPETMRVELERLLNRTVTGLERIGGGRNSQIYRVEADGGKRFALKAYFRHADDPRDRLQTEYSSFSFLRANGFSEVPQPVAVDPRLGWAVYQFIEGDKIAPGAARDTEVLAAVDFLGRLRELSRKPESRSLGAASEGFFVAGSIVDNLDQRLRRLGAAQGDKAPLAALREFLGQEFTPMLGRVKAWSESRLQAASMSLGQEISWSQRTLSPSDFGFHNALRQPAGRIIFLDFEYFGWDDPAKMIADFLLHPAMDLSPKLKRTFASAILQRFSDCPGLVGRVESVYPLFGLKWCLIFLNEFLPDSFQRRKFAAIAATERGALQKQQLEKARQMLHRIGAEYERFPYHD